MPLITEADYERFAEHLCAIDDVVGRFSTKYSYSLPQWPLSGRYPNRMMLRESGKLWQSIQITMDNDSEGERFDHFFPDIPYTIFAAAWIDDELTLTRWSSPSIRLDGIPFSRLVRNIQAYLHFFHQYLCSIDEASIRSFACSSDLDLRP